MAGAGLGDRALAALVAGAVLAGYETEKAHQPAGPLEAPEVADLDAQPDRAERVDAAQAAQTRDILRPRRRRDQRGDLAPRRSRRIINDWTASR
jgi:hypothetical protein